MTKKRAPLTLLALAALLASGGLAQTDSGAGPSTSSADDYRAGDIFSDMLDSGGQGPEMVVIPAGTFQMGCVSGRECIEFEQPVHEVTIPNAFAVSVYEVTFDAYDRFADTNLADDAGWGRDQRPVINVSWTDAHDYVGWLSEQTGQRYRLLTEAEWEYAARAGAETPYAWGEDIGVGRANCNGCGSSWDASETAPVGSFEPNEFGLHDMHGNAWEWVEDCWNGRYFDAPVDGSAWLSGDCRARVIRGGSWNSPPELLRSADRVRSETRARTFSLGFRVARELP